MTWIATEYLAIVLRTDLIISHFNQNSLHYNPTETHLSS